MFFEILLIIVVIMSTCLNNHENLDSLVLEWIIIFCLLFDYTDRNSWLEGDGVICGIWALIVMMH